MIRNILLTTLDAAANERSLRYYSVQNEYDRDYCEALQCMEASSKYILSRFAIDEILVIGEDASAAAGASTDPIMLKNSSDLYAAGIGEMIEDLFAQEIAGPGAVRATLVKYMA